MVYSVFHLGRFPIYFLYWSLISGIFFSFSLAHCKYAYTITAHFCEWRERLRCCYYSDPRHFLGPVKSGLSTSLKTHEAACMAWLPFIERLKFKFFKAFSDWSKWRSWPHPSHFSTLSNQPETMSMLWENAKRSLNDTCVKQAITCGYYAAGQLLSIRTRDNKDPCRSSS